MTARSEIHEGGRGHVSGDRLLQLGWPHFWLLIAILGGILALVMLVLFASVSL